jgi:PAS domain S-box-containing protein
MSGNPSRKITILSVDTDAGTTARIRASLDTLGYEVCGYVSSAPEAITKALEYRPDLIFMDTPAQRPASGINKTDIIKDILGIPVLYLSDADIPAVAGALEPDPCNYLSKSIDSPHLVSMIEAALRIRELQLRLKESEERFTSVTSNLPGAVFQLTVDDELKARIDYLSERGSDVFGIEKTPLSNYLERVIANVHPDDRRSWLQTFFNAARTGAKWDYEGRYINPRGGEIWLKIIAQPTHKDHTLIYSGIALDITDRKLSELKRRESEERYRTLFDQSPLGILHFDKNMIVTDCNERFLKMVHGRRDMAVGYDLKTLPAREFAAPTAALAGTIVSRDTRWETEDDPFGVHMIATTSPIRDEGGAVIGGIIVLEDVTGRKRAEEEHAQLDLQLQQTQKLESLGVLTGGIAHDFNNLLMVILGNIDLALLEIDPFSRARENLAEGEKAAHRAADLCMQMLAYAGYGHCVSEALNLNDVIRDMENMLEISVSKKASLRTDLTGAMAVIRADPVQIRQIIINLVTNASEAIGRDPGIISISTGVMACDRTDLSDTWLAENLSGGRYAYLEVADTGCGMGREELSRIFDPFFTTKFAGRGLALPAVLGIVRTHRGVIKVRSEKGKGSSFKILFPTMEDNGEKTGRTREIPEPWRGHGTVLLVDDEEPIRNLGKKMLEHLGFSVLTAGDGRQAVAVFQQNAAAIRCVIMDLTMPQMDGEEAFMELRRIKDDVCVLMSSGYDERESTERLAGKGLNGFIQKPYRLASLAERLKQILNEA